MNLAKIDEKAYAAVSQDELDALIKNPPIEPCGDYLLVRVEDVQATHGDILLPTGHVDREQKGAGLGYVIAMGPHAYTEDPEPWCETGDKVAFQRYEGVVPPIEGLDSGKYRIIQDTKVLGVIR